jgi:hypothetical protein
MNKLLSLMAFQFYAVAVLGMMAHAIKKWINNEITGDHIFRWYMDNPKYTVGVAMTVFGGAVTGISTGLLTNINDAAQVAL